MKFNYKKSLGQNFLIDNNKIKQIVDSIKVNNNDLIVEIGPGAGAITKELAKKDCDVICFEIDTRLKEILSKLENENLKIIYNDFLKIDLINYIDSSKYNKIIFVGNLPYYITTAIINKIIDFGHADEIIIMVQKEVAQRIMAKPNTKKYNSLSIYLQYNFDIEKVCDVNKNCFEPIPKVDSQVIKFKKSNKYKAYNEEIFYNLVKNAFTQKRKNLKNNLKSYDLIKIERILNKMGKDLTYRAENLSIEDFINISNEL